MSPGKLISLPCCLKAAIGVFVTISFSSCVIVKKFPKNQPFVYQTNINLNGDLPGEDKPALVSRLKAQLDDSIKSRAVSKLFWSVMKNPPLYDSTNADKSVKYMGILLNALGYFKDSIDYKTKVDTVEKDQYRATINFNVTPGKVVRLDSISYNIKDRDLQALTLANQKESLIKKGEPFAKATISVELDRLVDLFRNNGYLRFTRQELIGLWDTLDVSFMQPTLDPIEQLEILQKLKERQEHPTANLEIGLRLGFDSSKLKKFFVGDIKIYPNYNLDTTGYNRKEKVVNGIKVIYFRKTFKSKIFPPNIYFHRGDLYDQRNYFKTINRFNSMGAWRLVNIEQTPRGDEDTADFHIRLTPAPKYSFTANLEGSRNQSAVSGNLFGIAVNLGLQNRNFARAANQTNTNLRYGIEISSDSNFIQTQQFIISHNIYFPRLIPHFNWIKGKIRESSRTILSFNAGNTDRKDLYNLTTVNGSWGYEFQWNKKFLTIRLPNIEYSFLKSRSQLDTLFAHNPSLRNIFTDGLISSVVAGFSVNGGQNKNINVFRVNTEISGFPVGLIKNNRFLDSNLYRFVKLDAEFTRKIVYKKTALALRLFAGAGYELNSTVSPLKKNNLPFFKQYFAGGPNSMRAWGLRKLGPGSLVEDFTGLGGLFERYGDVQLESNIEWRFPLTTWQGVKLNGALFTDIGNVWALKKQGHTPEEVFNFSKLGKDLAVGAGAGLRVDFSFFVVRFDYSYKVKDPSPSLANAALQNKWFAYQIFGHNKQREATKFQLGISYPFIL